MRRSIRYHLVSREDVLVVVELPKVAIVTAPPDYYSDRGSESQHAISRLGFAPNTGMALTCKMVVFLGMGQIF